MPDHVVIGGGGIAGAAAAAAMATAGLRVTVIERRPDDQDGGAVVRVNPNAMDALHAIGLHQAVIAVSFPLLRSERRGPDGRRIAYRLSADPASSRGMARAMHWSRLAGALRAGAIDRGATFRHDREVIDVEENPDGVTVRLDDGSTVVADALVGADGVHSRIRRAIDPGAPSPRRLGTRTVYGFAPEPGVEPPPPEVLCAHLGGRRLLSFDDHALEHLPRWHTDRMIVIGDAAHVAPPASESGAAMAVEDGVLLGRCLRDHPDPRSAFIAFEELRRARVEAVVRLGLAGTRGAHQSNAAARLRTCQDRVRRLTDWQRRPPTGGPAWLLDHHIQWDRST